MHALAAAAAAAARPRGARLPYLEQGNLHIPRNAGLGAELSLNAALQFVRLSVGANDLLSTNGAPRTVMVRLGFSNLNGLIYWAGSAL